MQDNILFKEAMQGVIPIKQDCHIPFSAKNKKKQAICREQRVTEDTLFFFSDEYEPLFEDENTVKYLRAGENSHLLKQLRRGDFSPEIFLDLHGVTKKQAKLELASLLLACEKEHFFCTSIMTGYGTLTLKHQIPRWLVQHPRVRALHQAPREWGGDASILVLLDI